MIAEILSTCGYMHKPDSRDECWQLTNVEGRTWLAVSRVSVMTKLNHASDSWPDFKIFVASPLRTEKFKNFAFIRFTLKAFVA